MLEKLNDLLRSYIEEKGVNISTFSERIDVPRSKLYRFLDGSSLPDVEELTRLYNALCLSNSERLRLANAYKASKLNGVAQTRQQIEDVICELNIAKDTPRLYTAQQEEPLNSCSVQCDIIESSETLYTFFWNTFSMESNKDLLILSQLENRKLFTYIANTLSNTKPCSAIKHGFRIRPGYDKNENLILYKQIIELCLINENINARYIPKFMYTNDLINREMEIFPNVIVNERIAILYSEDFNSGIVLRNEQHVELIYQRACHILDQMENFVSSKETPYEAASFFTQFDEQPTRAKVYMVESQPCFALLPPEYYESLLEEDLLNAARIRHQSLMHKLQKRETEYHQFFTKDGITTMLKNLRHIDIPAYLQQKLKSNKIFKQLIQQTIQQAREKDQVRLHLFNTNFLELSEKSFVFTVYRGNSVIISTPINNINENQTFKTLAIVERGIVDAFSDYFDGLIKDYSLLGEETPLSSDEKAICYLESILDKI